MERPVSENSGTIKNMGPTGSATHKNNKPLWRDQCQRIRDQGKKSEFDLIGIRCTKNNTPDQSVEGARGSGTKEKIWICPDPKKTKINKPDIRGCRTMEKCGSDRIQNDQIIKLIWRDHRKNVNLTRSARLKTTNLISSMESQCRGTTNLISSMERPVSRNN